MTKGRMDRGISITLISSLVALSIALPLKEVGVNQELQTQTKEPEQVKILKQINRLNDDGSYTYGYEADDGSFKVETRDKDGVVKGKYGFVDANGQLKSTEYTAGEKSASAEDIVDDQKIAAQTPKAETTAAKGRGNDASNSDEDERATPQDVGNTGNGDFGSFVSQQQGLPLVYSQGQPGQFGGFNGSPFPGGPQYRPSGGFVQGQPGFQNQAQQFPGQFGGFQGQQINSGQVGQLSGQQFIRPQIRPGSGAGLVNLSGGQFTGPTSGGFPIVSTSGERNALSNPQTFSTQRQVESEGEYTNSALDGFSEDTDQDGFVNTFPGSRGSTRLSQNTGNSAAGQTSEAARLGTAPQSPPQSQLLRIQNNGGIQGRPQPGTAPFLYRPQTGGAPIIYQQQQGLTDDQLQNIYQIQNQQNLQGVSQGVQPGSVSQLFNPQAQQFASGAFPGSSGRFPTQQQFQQGQQFNQVPFQFAGQYPTQGFNQIPSGAFPSSGVQGEGVVLGNPQFSQQPQQFGQAIRPTGISSSGQQFANVQNFLPQGVQQQFSPQFLQGGQSFNPQNIQQGNSGIQSDGFPFDYNPYAGRGFAGAGGPFLGQFAGGQPVFQGIQGQQVQSGNPQAISAGEQGAVTSGGIPSASQKSVTESSADKKN